MKIVFLCSSIEIGCDGVGDYTRRLGANMVKLGHEVVIVSFNDKYISQDVSEVQLIEGSMIKTYRFPAIWNAKKRFSFVKKVIDIVNPEWISLQFVPFSFHRKGLLIGMKEYVNTIGKGKLWHLMCHELWTGMYREAPFKYYLLGLLQKTLIKSFLNNLNPSVVTTHSQLYQLQLAKLGIQADILPLFSNIPIFNHNLGTVNKSLSNLYLKKKFSMVIFGSIHPNEKVISFAKEVSAFEQKFKTKISLVILGRCGKEQEYWADIWRSENLNVELLGEQSPECVSKVLTSSTFGISTMPISLIEKSSSVATMIGHGLPVISISQPWNARDTTVLRSPDGCYEYNIGNLEETLTKLYNRPLINDIMQITKKFSELLMSAHV